MENPQSVGHDWVVDDAEDPNPHDTMWYCTRCEIFHLQPSDMPRPTPEMKKRSRLSGDMALTCEETKVLQVLEE